MKDEIIIEEGGWGFGEFIDSYLWKGNKWVYHTNRWSYDHHGITIHSSVEERPISMEEASDILHKYGLTKEDVSLEHVSITPPGRLEEIASSKQRIQS